MDRVGAVVVAAYATAAGALRARRARRVSQEPLSFAWRSEWRTPGSVQVTNEGLDTAFDVDVRVTFQAVTHDHRLRRIAADESVELPLPGLGQYWHAIDQRRAETAQSGPLSLNPPCRSLGEVV